MRTPSMAPGVVVELQTNRWFFLPALLMALATGCIAFSKNSLEKLPSGRLGEGGIKNDTSVATIFRGSSVARSHEPPAPIVSAHSGSSTGRTPSVLAAP